MTQTDFETITLEIADGVALVRINRPKALNVGDVDPLTMGLKH